MEPAEPGPPSRGAPVVAMGAITLTMLYSWHFASLQTLVDDAFISFRYADTFVRHGELVFNLGERVEGYSNPLWTLLLALGSALGVSPPLFAPLLGYVAGLATLGLVVACACRGFSCSLEVAFVAAGLIALQPAWAFWAGAGLETPMFGLALLALWASVWLFDGWLGSLLAALTAAVVALSRPEGGLLAWLVVPALAVRGARRQELAVAALAIAFVIGAHLAWRHSYYGGWIPTSAVAKSVFTVAGFGRGLAYIWSYLHCEGVLFLLPLVWLSRRWEHRTTTLWFLVIAYAGFIVLVGGDGLYRHRLLAHVTPLVILGVTPGIQAVADRGGSWRAILGVGLAVNLLVPLAQPKFFRQFTLADVREWEQEWSLVGQALAEEMPPDATLATNVVGRVPYYSRLPTLDLLGLTDPVIAAAPVEHAGRGYAGHERAAPGYVLSREPDVLYISVLDGLPFAAFCRVAVIREVLRQGSLHRYAQLLEDQRFLRAYAPARLPLQDGRAANLFVRRTQRTRLEPHAWGE